MSEISSLQDLMGAVNDRTMAKTVLTDWITNTEAARQRAFFRGMLLAETKAHDDLRRGFHAIWTPELVRRLRRMLPRLLWKRPSINGTATATCESTGP